VVVQRRPQGGLAAAEQPLAGGDVHGDFEAETQIAGLRGGPGHEVSPLWVCEVWVHFLNPNSSYPGPFQRAPPKSLEMSSDFHDLGRGWVEAKFLIAQ